MPVLTIGGKDFEAAFNLRALRLFKKETEQSLPNALASLGGGEDATEVDFGTLAYIIWALANAKPNGPDFEFVESSIDIDNIKGVMEQLATLRSDEEPATPLPEVTEETSQ